MRRSGKRRKAVFLDRDGVINQSFVLNGKPYPPNSLATLKILPGVTSALSKLRAAGYLNIVVTNQPDVSTGKQTHDELLSMHRMLGDSLAIDDFKVCSHVDSDACYCRKPQPGMLLEAATQWAIDLSDSYLIGDRWRDVGAGQAAGCRCFFIDYGYSEIQPKPPFVKVKSLAEAANLILVNNIHL